MPATTPPQTDKPKKYLAYFWLSYCGFIFIEPVTEPSVSIWVATLISFAVFLFIFSRYIRCIDTGSTKANSLIFATVILGLLSLPWNGGTSTYFVYAAGFIAFNVVSIPRVFLLLIAESLSIVAEHFLFPTHRVFFHTAFHVNWPNTIFAILLIFIVGVSNIFFAQQKRSDTKLRMAQEEIEALAALAERERIARDLHDVLGHNLSVITLKAELAGRLLQNDPDRAATEIAEVESLARIALSEVREAIGGYRARGLAAEIESARRTLDAAGVTLIAEMPHEKNSTLNAAEETVLALAVREAVTNIVRHAKATQCKLRFVTEGGRRKLLVEDNGAHGTMREGNGLRGMRERVESIGGKLSLQRDRGTTLLIELPQAKSAA